VKLIRLRTFPRSANAHIGTCSTTLLDFGYLCSHFIAYCLVKRDEYAELVMVDMYPATSPLLSLCLLCCEVVASCRAASRLERLVLCSGTPVQRRLGPRSNPMVPNALLPSVTHFLLFSVSFSPVLRLPTLLRLGLLGEFQTWIRDAACVDRSRTLGIRPSHEAFALSGSQKGGSACVRWCKAHS
jgi:hypothetical protein